MFTVPASTLLSGLRYVCMPFIILCTLAVPAPVSALEQVTLQLKWLHQFQFAGYYAAVQQGYYRDAGLNVTIVPATPGKDPVLNVINGTAQYGVGTSSLLLERNAGKPVVALAVIFQHSAQILLAREYSTVQTIHSLLGKRLILRPQSEELLAYLTKEGVTMERLEQSYTVQDLISGKADAVSGYITNEPDILARAGFPYHAYTPRSAGIDFYGDNLFTTESELKNHPARAKAFREASLKGWHYALQNPEEIINLIISDYSPHADRAHLKFEAEQIKNLIQPDLVEIGYMHEGRWRHIADTYNELGMLPKNVNLTKFMYDPHPDKDLKLIYQIVAVASGLLLLFFAVRLIIASRKLKVSDRQLRRMNESLEEQVLARTEDVRAAHEHLELMTSAVPSVLYQFLSKPTGEWKFLYMSKGIIDLYGVTPEDALRDHSFLTNCILPEDLVSHRESVAEATRHLQHWVHEHRIKTPGGKVKWVRGQAIPQSNDNGSVLWNGVLIDITERKLAEDELRCAKENVEAAKEQLLLAAQAGGVGFWEYDVVNDTLVWDQQMYSMYGIQPDSFENVYQAWVKVLHPDDVLRVNDDVKLALSGEKEYVLEFRVVWPDYSIHTISAAGIVQRDESGKPLRMIGTNWDLTTIRLAEEEILKISNKLKETNSELNSALISAKQSNNAKSQFLSNMSHEIRTPLNAIIGFSALTLNSELSPRQRDYIQKVNNAGEALLSVINDILDFSKIEAGQLKLEQIPFMLEPLLANAVSMLQSKAALKGLPIRIETSQDINSCLIGDPHRLGQVIVNLLANAVKFTEQGGIVLETALLNNENGQQQLTISVRDTGIGIPAKKINKLFKPFTQADESTTRRFGGTGLGLSICKQLVELMGGTIGCKSKSGHGSTFSFTVCFPVCGYKELQQCMTHCSTVAKNTQVSFDFSNSRILLVEDNEVNRQLAVELLHGTGVTIDEAADGAQAVELLFNGTHAYDLVLMDIQMPIMDGYMATRLIRADRRFDALPIIAMTAHALLDEQEKILLSGMDAHIAKPIDARSMLRMVALFLGTHDSSAATPEYTAVSGGDTAWSTAMPELDVAGALERLDGNRKIYDWLLRSFLENKSGTVAEIQDALNSGDMELAERLAHTLKSSAGSIGVVELESLMQSLETAICQGEPAVDQAEIISRSAALMEHLLTTLASQLPALVPPASSTTTIALDTAVVTPILERLLGYIHACDCTAERYLDDFHNELLALPVQDLELLKKHLKNFDFRDAEGVLVALAKQHGIELHHAE
jgi:PAS domain S-box-containing protein